MQKKRWLLYSALSLTALPACQSISDLPSKIDPKPNPNSIRDLPNERFGEPSADITSDPTEEPAAAGMQEELIYGDQVFFKTTDIAKGVGATGEKSSAQGENFIFRNAPIDAVLNEVLGEAFGLSYSLDPGIKGTVTIRLDGIATADEALDGLGAALGLQGIEISEISGTYVVSKKGKANRTSGSPVFLAGEDSVPAGTSLAVLQIRFSSVDEVASLAKSILPADIIRYSDDTRGFVVLSGTPDEVSSAVQLLKSLDVNWLNSVSTALIPISNTSPTELAADLDPILKRMGGVSVVPLDRLQTLMVISRQRETLDQTRDWISRLDQDARPQVTQDILVYEARYVNADDLVSLTDGGASGSRKSFRETALHGQPSNGVGYTSDEVSSGPPRNQFSSPDNSLYANLSIKVDPGRNAIVARGANNELKSLGNLLSLLDKPNRQVLIEATIVEVSLSDGQSMGVQWDLVQDRLSATFSDNGSGAVTSLFPGASVSYINKDVSAVVNALATTSDVEIVSSPRILVLNNETARLQIGDQVPIITQSAVSITDPGAPVVNSTSYRDTGVILTVTPKIRAGGMVEIDVSQEVSGVSETTTSSIDSPTISQRSVQSVLAVPDGSTAVLGGLMSSTRSYSQTGVPLLKNLPILGSAFRSTSETERQTELVILVEPTVVESAEPSTDIPMRLRQALISARERQQP